MRLVGRAERGTAGAPGQTAFGRPNLDAFFRRNDAVWGATLNHPPGDCASAHRTASPRRTRPRPTSRWTRRTRRRSTGGPRRSSSPTSRTTAGPTCGATTPAIKWTETWTTARAGAHVDTALIDWEGERAALTDALNGGDVPASRDNVGLTLQHQALWSRIFVTGGVRIEHNASFGTAAVPRLGAAWYVRQGGSAAGPTRIHASAGRSIKEPTILQSFSQNPFFLGNPDLEPERARALDVGVEQRFANDRLRVDLTWFDNRYRDIISTQTISFTPFTSQYFNIGLTRARGAELTGDLALVSGFRAKAGYTFTDSAIVDSTSASAVFTAGNWAFRRPRHAGFVDLAWNGARASIDLAGTLVGRRVDSDFASLVPSISFNDRYASWDLRASWRFTGQLTLTSAVDNLTNADRMEPLGYPVLSRAIRFGVRARF